MNPGIPPPRHWIAILALACSAAGLAAQPAPPKPLSELPVEPITDDPQAPVLGQRFLETWRRANGGDEAFAGLRTFHRAGNWREGRNEYRTEEWYRFPDAFRIEREWREAGRVHRVVEAYDGDTVWRQVLLPRPGRIEDLVAGDRARLQVQADLWGPLDDAPSVGHRFLYVRPETVGGRRAFLVQALLADDTARWYWFDAQTYLPFRVGFRESFAGRPAEVDRWDARITRRGSLWFPEVTEWTTGGTVYRRVEWTLIEVNPTLPEGQFLPPPRREIVLRQR